MTPWFRLLLHSNGTVYDRIIFVCIWAATFLVPIFFLPFSTDPLEFNKAYLFLLLVLVGTITWLLKYVLAREGVVARLGVELPLALFAIVSILATAFSLYPFRSAVGTSGNVAESLASTLGFILFFFLMLNALRRDQLPWIFGALMLSAGVVNVFNFLQVFGVFLLPWDFSKIATFHALANSSMTFSVFSGLAVVLAFLKLMQGHRTWIRVYAFLLLLLSLFLMLVYDQAVGWIILIAGLILTVVFLNVASRKPSAARLLVPTILIGFSVIALVVNTQALLRSNIPSDIALPPSIGGAVAWQAVQRVPLLGSGPGTFDTDLAQFRPASFNSSALWNTRFIRSANVWLHLLPTVGVIGTLAFAVFTLMVLRRMLLLVVRTKKDHPFWWYHAGVFLALFGVLLASIFMSFPFLLFFLLWLLLGASAVLLRAERNGEKSGVKTATTKPTTSFTASLLFTIALVVGIIMVYFGTRFWVADFHMARANAAVKRVDDLGKIQNYLTWSLDLNPFEQTGYYDLAQNLLVQAQLLAREEKPDLTKLRVLVTGSVAAAQTGAAKYPRSPASYEALSAVFQAVDTLTGTTSEETKNAYLKAIELEPNNPQLQANLGQYYLSVARSRVQQANAGEKPDDALLAKAQEALESARQAFAKAAEIKPDYIDARINIALALRLQNKGADAVAYLEDLAANNPFNSDVLFNLAENYLLDGQQEKAQAILTRVVSIFPGHSDSHARLAEIYEKKGDIENAVKELTTVKRLNPGVT
ncbi:MAG: tetratricopeptide repeat protein, partial [Candidatus Kerfeldbacteria bacterium]|nr:tetratricopeptide repeat protein [Candidatus Kerfeldbacteria bacterium]